MTELENHGLLESQLVAQAMGNYVTRAELKAHLDPITGDVHEIKGDVKKLLMRDAGESAVAKRSRFISTRLLSWGALLVGALSPVAWTHHF